MDIDLQPGRYVVAVSGGVDSVALLHLLARQPGVRLTVAHYDHGIRADSTEDRKFVQTLAKEYEVPFAYGTGNLGATASEAKAREARYKFLHDTRSASGARAIITAHHQDDVLETIILNLLRGTGRRGLSSLKSTDTVKRPLLRVPKKELLRFAKEQGLRWHEDSTNNDDRYLRNYVRRHLLPRFADADRATLLDIASRAALVNRELADQLANYLHVQPTGAQLDRAQFILLPHAVAREVMGEWLRQRGNVELSRQLLERLVVAAKTARAGSRMDVDAGHWMRVNRATLALEPRER